MNAFLILYLSLSACGKMSASTDTRKAPPPLQLHVVPQSTASQKPHYDAKKREGRLDLLVEYHKTGDRGSISLSTVTLAYLYTEYDQSQLDYPFDNERAHIYLKIPKKSKGEPEERIEVGQYEPALNFGILPPSTSGLLPSEYWQSHGRWITPTLCTGDYESVCHLEVKIKKSRSTFTPGQKISVFLYVGQSQKPVYEATSKKENP